jgi:hypothetical protein
LVNPTTAIVLAWSRISRMVDGSFIAPSLL